MTYLNFSIKKFSELIKSNDSKLSKMLLYDFVRAVLNKEYSLENFIPIMENLHKVI